MKVFNNLQRSYEVIDVIISSKETTDLKIIYEENTKKISSLAKEKTLGHLKLVPTSFDKNGYIEGSIYLILNDTNWTPEDQDRQYIFIKIGLAGAYYDQMITYDQLEFSSFLGRNFLSFTFLEIYI